MARLAERLVPATEDPGSNPAMSNFYKKWKTMERSFGSIGLIEFGQRYLFFIEKPIFKNSN